jgi:hypothetical protein
VAIPHVLCVPDVANAQKNEATGGVGVGASVVGTAVGALDSLTMQILYPDRITLPSDSQSIVEPAETARPSNAACVLSRAPVSLMRT